MNGEHVTDDAGNCIIQCPGCAGTVAPFTSKMRVACATTSHDVEEGECPWCTIERLKRERNQLIAAIGEHVTVRSDQYAEIQRLRAALERCRLASGLAKAEIIDAALSGEPNSAPETQPAPASNPSYTVDPYENPLPDIRPAPASKNPSLPQLQTGAQVLWEKQFEDTPWAGKVHLIRPDSLGEYTEVARSVWVAMISADPTSPPETRGESRAEFERDRGFGYRPDPACTYPHCQCKGLHHCRSFPEKADELRELHDRRAAEKGWPTSENGSEESA